MKHSIVELISNRIVYHTGGSNGPGNNSDGSGDEHADGSRSSNGSFGGSSDGGGGSDRERSKPTLEKANVVDAGLEESREVKSSLNAQAKNFQEFAGYAGPGRELSPGDIDPDTGREVSSVDDNGRPTGYTDAAGDNSSDTPSAYAGPGRELSPGDIDPDNGRVVSEVDDYGRPTKYDDSGVGNGTADRQFSPGEIDPETGRVVAEVDDYGRPTKYENPPGTVGPGTVDPDIPSDEEIPGHTVQEDGSILVDPIVVTEDDVPHQDEYPGGDGGDGGGNSDSSSGSNSSHSTVSDWHTAFSMLQTVNLETIGFIAKVIDEFPEAATGLKSFAKYAKVVGGPPGVLTGGVIAAGLAALEGKGASEIAEAAAEGTLSGAIGWGLGYVVAAATVGTVGIPAALVGVAVGITWGLMDASAGWTNQAFDPVLLDLSNDDFQLIDLAESAAMFDYDADSFLENVGWVSGDDGILAIDLDGSGLIDAAAEFVFAGETEAEDTDLEALAELYDSNEDGVLNAEDAQWSQFRVWQDWNGDGQSQEGEVSTLEELNIAEIGLVSDGVEEEIDGNTIHGRATFTREDGTTGDVGDVSFQASAFGYRDTEEGTEIGDGNTLVLDGDEDQKRDLAGGNYDGLITGGGDDTLVNSAGRDAFLSSGAGDDTLVGGDGNDWLLGGDGADTLAGGHGHDILFADAADSIDGGDGFDVVLGQGDGDLNIDLGKTRTEAVYGAEGDDHFRAGDAHDVTIDGGAGDDQVTGGAGDDLLSGGSGADTLIGGAGDDTLIIDEFDALHGGAGQDRVIFMGDADLDINITDYGVEIFNAGGGDDIIRTDQAVAAAIDGGEGNDTVFGGWGADWLSGGHGDDSLLGGFGNDTYAFGRGDGTETIHDYSHNTRIDTIYDLYSDGSKKNVRTRTVDIHENAGEDQIVFGASIDPDDLLIKADGQDILIALKDPNNPDASFDELDDQLRLVNWQDERDRVEKITFSSGTSLDLNAMLQNLGFIGDGTVLDVGAAMIAKLGEYADGIGEGGIGLAGTSEGEALLGSDQDDVVVAGAGHDVIGGGAGNDQLYGQDGDDILSGGDGSDLLDGGAGDDIIISDGNDTIIGGDGNDSLKFFNENGVQVDLSDAEIENVLGSMGDDELSAIGLEDAIYMDGEAGNDTLISGGGNDTLLGDFGDDVLDGGAGDDRLVGGAGDDRFIGNEGADTMLGGDGEDIVDYSGSDQGVELSLETGGTSGDAAGDSFDGIENVIGTNQNDVIAGDGADNTLDAGAGDDSLSGQDGDDHLLAGDGDDILDGGQGDDVLDGGAGADQLSGGDGQDQLAGGAGDDHLTGGMGADRLSGGEGNDVLDAGEGVDLVDAGAGDDTIIGRGDGDVIDGGAGSDLLDYGQSDDGVRLDMSDTKGYEAEHLEDRAQDIETVSGSAFNDDLAGSALSETFEAGAGDDTVSGRLGDDELSGGAGDDTLLGQQGDDVLHGGSGYDILSGGSGDDTLHGGEGDNLLFGGEGNDEAVFAGSRDDYDFVQDGDDLIVIGVEGETRLSDIETIRFDDEVFNVEELLADEDIPVTTENRQRRDEQYQTALAASVASAVALGGLASTYDNTAQAAERIEAGADTGDGDVADVWIVEPVSSGGANDPFVAGASDGDLLTGSGPESDENLNLAQPGGNMSGETTASNSNSTITGETVSDSGNDIETMPEMIGTIVSDPSEEPSVPDNAAENPEDAEEEQAAANDDASEIIPLNLAPIVTADFAHTLEDQEIRVKIADLLANDFDPERMRLEFVSLGSVSGGSVRIDGGYLVFSPDPDFHGDALISYSLRDNFNNIVSSRLTIAVTEVNDIPVVTGERASGSEDTVLRLSIAELLANDSDMDGDSLSLSSLVGVEHGTAEIDGDDILFTPDANHNGEAVLRYAVSDGRGGQTIGTVRIDIAAVNDAPVAGDDTRSSLEDNSLSIRLAELLSNDADVDGDTLAITGIVSAQHGNAIIENDQILFTPDEDFNGTASVVYRLSDGNGGISTGVVSINVLSVNDASVAVDDWFSTNEDRSISIPSESLLSNDHDSDNDMLVVTGVSDPVGGTVTLDNGNITFLPSANFNGSASFKYQIDDGNGGTAEATVTVQVVAVNDAPDLVDDTAATDEDQAIELAITDLLANDSDIEGDSLTLTAITSATGGTATIEDGKVIFRPDADFHGEASFTYRVEDSQGGISEATTQIAVTEINDVPVVTGERVSGREDTVLRLSIADLLANDSDVDGDLLSLTSLVGFEHGTAEIDGGDILFTPDANHNGEAILRYAVSDGRGGQAIGTVRIDVAAVNDAPDLVDDTSETDEDQAIELFIADLLANDSDIEGDSLSLTAITSATGGTAAIEDGKVIFRPDADFHGEASFTYRVEDGQGGISEAITRIAVTEVNDVPVVTGERVSGREDTVLRLSIADLLANDSDVDGDLLSLTSLVGFEHGTAELDGDDILFTPDANYNGEAILRYTVSDGRGGQTIGTVRIDVAAVNDAPDLQDDVLQTDEDQALQLNVADLLANDSDREGDTLAVIGVEAVSGGTVSLSGDTITFTPDADFNGIARFKYQVDDGNGGVSTAFADLAVTAVNDAPVIEVIADTRTHYHQALALTSLVSASDIDGDALYIELRDAANLGHFEVDGQAVADQSIVRVLLSEIDRVRFVPVAYPDSVETLQIRAFDGDIYTDWKPLAVTADNTVLGTEGADELMAGDIGDILDGFAGNDTLTGGPGDDLLLGRDGDDTLLGGTGNDTLYGGEGDDTIVAGAGNNSIWAGNGNDRIEISNLDDLTRLDAGDGRDRLVLQTDEDVTLDISTVYAEEIEAGAGNDVLYSNGAEDLYIHAGDGDDVLLGGDGNDTLIGGVGKDRIEGGAGDDIIEVGLGDNLADIDGGSGNDTLMVSDGVDITIDMTGSGIENVVGGAGKETVTDLALEGSSVSLGAGDDTVVAGSGVDILEGGAGSDTLDYSQSTSSININLAENSVTGGTGDGDTISGFENVNDTAFDDVIIGDGEDNRLLSSSGNDDLTGGDGADEFVINLDPSATGTVRIRDFSPINGDMLSLAGLGAAGTIAAITNALASQTMNDDGDVTLSFADGRSVIFEGLGEPFTAEMTTAPVVVAEETISDEQSGELIVRVALSRAVDEDVLIDLQMEDRTAHVSDDLAVGAGLISIAAGDHFGETSVSLVSEDSIEGSETLGIRLVNIHSSSEITNPLSIGSSEVRLIDEGSIKGQVSPDVFDLISVREEDVRYSGSTEQLPSFLIGSPRPINGEYFVHIEDIDEIIAQSVSKFDGKGLQSLNYSYSVRTDVSVIGAVITSYRLRYGGEFGEWKQVSVDGHNRPLGNIGTGTLDLNGGGVIEIGEKENLEEIEVKSEYFLDMIIADSMDPIWGIHSGYIHLNSIVATYERDSLVYEVGDIDGDGVVDGAYYNGELEGYVFLKGGAINKGNEILVLSNDLGPAAVTMFGAGVGEEQHLVTFIAVGNELKMLTNADSSGEVKLSDLDALVFNKKIVAATGAGINSSGKDSLVVAIGENDTISEIQIIRTDGAETLNQDHVAAAQRIIVPDGIYTGLANLGDTNSDGIEELGLLSADGVTRIEQSVFLRSGDIIQLGSSADDTLIALDNAVISGLSGDDDYSIQTGVGDVIIANEGSSLADHDRIVFEDGISAEQLWFTRNGNDLLLEVLGTDDSVTVADWYGGDLSAKIDAITLQDGSELAGYEIEKIVTLMAAIDKPEDIGAATETLANAGLTDDVEELWAAG